LINGKLINGKLINGKLTKWQVDQCHVDKTRSWQNGSSMQYQVDETAEHQLFEIVGVLV
jgi:hypothetical protein